MKRIGDEISGFSAAFDAETVAVRVRGWGFWNAMVAEAFVGIVGDVCGTAPRGVPLLMDMTELKPLREEGQRSFGALIRALEVLRVGRVEVTTASHLIKLQLLRLVTEHGGKVPVEFNTIDRDPLRESATDKPKRERVSR